jgi:hypothetical protein
VTPNSPAAGQQTASSTYVRALENADTMQRF